jgi:carbonic anhydrase/acetyltransferase-like protein (isoleucine patch superfamily)
MPIHPYRGVLPRLGERVFPAPGAELVGDVQVGDDVSFWFHTVARGDVSSIRIGDGANVRDGAVLNVGYRTHPLVVGCGVTIASTPTSAAVGGDPRERGR